MYLWQEPASVAPIATTRAGRTTAIQMTNALSYSLLQRRTNTLMHVNTASNSNQEITGAQLVSRSKSIVLRIAFDKLLYNTHS